MFNQGFTVSGSSLKLLKVGERGVVSRLNAVNDNTDRKLRAMGIVPGVTITLEQRFPRFVVRVGADRLAISEEMIRSIYVRVTSQQPAKGKVAQSSSGAPHLYASFQRT